MPWLNIPQTLARSFPASTGFHATAKSVPPDQEGQTHANPQVEDSFPTPSPSSTLAHLIDDACLVNTGNVVALPTETVYGLAGLALDEDAVRKIFALKGRPATNPLIVHVPIWVRLRNFAR